MLKLLVNMSRFANRTFALWIIISGIIGFIFPEIFKQLVPWFGPLLGVVMFGMGLTLTPQDFRNVFTRPRDVAIGVVAQYTVMPLSAFVIAKAFNLPPELAVGLMLLGCCPGGTASNVVTFLARGDVPLSVTITSCTTLLAPIMTPTLMYLFANQWIQINPMAMFLSIVQIVLVPTVLGVIVNRFFGKHLQTVQASLPLVSVVAIMMIAAGIVAKTNHQLLETGPMIFMAMALHNFVGMGLGWSVGKFFGLSLAKCKTLTFEVGMQNAGLGVALAGLHFAASPMTALPSTLGALWHNVTGPMLATYFSSRREKGEKLSYLDKLETQVG